MKECMEKLKSGANKIFAACSLALFGVAAYSSSALANWQHHESAPSAEVSLSSVTKSATKQIPFAWNGKVGAPEVGTGLFIRFAAETVDPMKGSVVFFPDHFYDTPGYISFATTAAFKVYPSQEPTADPIAFNYQLTTFDLSINGAPILEENVKDYVALKIDSVDYFKPEIDPTAHTDANRNLELFPEFNSFGPTNLLTGGDQVSVSARLLITPYNAI